MRNKNAILGLIAGLLLLAGSAGAVERIVLLEYFTNSG